MKVLRNMSLESFCMGEKVYSETKKTDRRKLPFVTQPYPALQNFKNIHLKTNLFHYIAKENNLKIS